MTLNRIGKDFICLKLGIDRFKIPTITTVRYRYWIDKVKRGPLHRKGYEDKILTKGLLPHSREFDKRLPGKIFKPRNEWAPKNALFGQNDYIDILGTGKLRPTDVGYTVPGWLRGFKGNEFQMLLQRQRILGEKILENTPTKYSDMELRRKNLYKYLNTKTKDYYWKDK